MTVLEFLDYLQSLDIKLWVESDQLRVNAPKGILTPAIRDNLLQRKAELISLLRQLDGEKGSEHKYSLEIIPQNRNTNFFPLSFSQKRLWFLDQLEPGNPAYNISVAIRLNGNLNVDALEESLTEIVRRHETLRTTFTLVNEQPMQVIYAPFPVPMPMITLHASSKADQETKLQEVIFENASYRFDLVTGPLLQVKLVKLNDIHHVFIFTIYHIISDGWSVFVFIRELQTLYQAFVDGQTSPLADLPVQYVDFAHWQDEWLQGNVLESQLGYWKKQLAAPLPVLELPVDYARPKTQTFNGAREMVALSESLSSALKELNRKEGCTMFMTLLAAFSVLLYRQTGQADIVVGSPIAGRSRVELEGLIGFFLNTLAMRVNLDGNPTFRGLIQHVREVALQAYANQDVPFEKLLEELHPERSISRTPIFQVFFNMLNFNEGSLDFANLKGEYVYQKDTEARFDLTLYVREEHKRINLVFVYNSDLFFRDHVTDLLAQYTQILEQIAVNPDQSISTLPLIPEAEIEKRRTNIPLIEGYIPFNIADLRLFPPASSPLLIDFPITWPSKPTNIS